MDGTTASAGELFAVHALANSLQQIDTKLANSLRQIDTTPLMDSPHPREDDGTLADIDLHNSEREREISSLKKSLTDLSSRLAALEMEPNLKNSKTSQIKEKATKPKHRNIAFFEIKYDKRTGKRTEEEVDDLVEDDVSDGPQPIVVRRTFKGDSKTIDRTEVIIKSRRLNELLLDIMSSYLDHEFRQTFAQKTVVMESPFLALIFNWEQLRTATTDVQVLQKHGSEAIQELEDLLGITERLAPDYTQSLKNILQTKTVTKKYLFTLFKPGSLVVTMPHPNCPQLMKIHHFGAGSSMNVHDTSSVFCEGYDWNGTNLEKVRYEFPMPRMEATEQFRVRDLPCYPLALYEDELGDTGGRKLCQSLIARGQKFEKLCLLQSEMGRSYRYNGTFQVEGDLRTGLLSSLPRYRDFDLDYLSLGGPRSRALPLKAPSATTKEVVIDFRSFREYGPREARNGSLSPQYGTPCNCSLCMSEESKKWMARFGQHNNQESLGVQENMIDYALLPPRALGFALKGKLWGQFLITEIEKFESMAADSTFDRDLIFPEGKDDRNKRILKDLIVHHGNQSFKPITDSINGKGQGLVLLFHGPPGVGKTMTAEALAKSCRKPLLSAGIGDLGNSAETVEQSLNKLFDVVTAWGGILLIDEADVLLDSRGSRGEVYPQQNAMVSVMLRLLEYFSGILILTTNRVKSIDYAIMSRISYAINFKDLNQAHQRTICENYLNQAADKIHIKEVEKEKIRNMIVRFKQNEGLNGREIRTMFTTAQLLGGGELTADNMDEVREQQRAFKDDMRTMYIQAETAAVVK
ncbi:hypothetical protein ACLMJK_000120 [Lecanora helva]